MEDSLLTKCPHCKTLFRINYDHLAVADGQVRCGVCFKVFNAPSEGLSYSEGPGSDRDTTFGHKIAARGQAEASPTAAGTPAPAHHHVAQLQIDDEPLEAVLFTNTQRHSGRPLLWGTLSVAALVLLGLQWAWFAKDRYAHQPQWHRWYATACSALNCKLPEYRDIDQLGTERLEVRSHPEYRNALIVDMVVNNTGLGRQPLPALNMEFYDINGAIVAQRMFGPDDYLAGVNNPINSISVRAPVHFSFAIIDPGEDAVNYAIELAEAPQQTN